RAVRRIDEGQQAVSELAALFEASSERGRARIASDDDVVDLRPELAADISAQLAGAGAIGHQRDQAVEREQPHEDTADVEAQQILEGHESQRSVRDLLEAVVSRGPEVRSVEAAIDAHPGAGEKEQPERHSEQQRFDRTEDEKDTLQGQQDTRLI